MKSMLIISYSLLHRDPRILRQIETFRNEFTIETIGYTDSNQEIPFYKVSTVLYKTFADKIRFAFTLLFSNIFCKEKFLDKDLNIIELEKENISVPDIIIANDWNGLYSACRLKELKGWKSKIYFDSHEYFPKYRESLVWKFFFRPQILYTLKKYKNSFDIMSTVCPTLARMYENYFGFEENTVRVVTNSLDYEEKLIPQPVNEKIRIIHHGGAMKARQLEKMIDMMEYLPSEKYELNFMLVQSDKGYYEELIKRASKYKNINFLDPVPFDKIPEFTNQFDIGLFILNNKIVNYKFALPNKFFEFVQTRLAIAIGDSPEMRNYLEKYNLGVSAKSNSPKALAEEILKLSKDDIYRYKQNAHRCAQELSDESNKKLLKEIAGEPSK